MKLSGRYKWERNHRDSAMGRDEVTNAVQRAGKTSNSADSDGYPLGETGGKEKKDKCSRWDVCGEKYASSSS